jgi:hypothetical protein
MDDEVVNSHTVDCACVNHTVVLLVYKSGKVKCTSAGLCWLRCPGCRYDVY